MLESSLKSVEQMASITLRGRHMKLRLSVLTATLVACLGKLGYGFLLGCASPNAKQLQERFSLSDEALS